MKKENIGNFSYNKLGEINYTSNGIHLAEFDVLGYKDNNIYFWEITKSHQGGGILRNEIECKKELLKKVFPNMNIIFKLILPKVIAEYEYYNIEIIEEPDYSMFINMEYLKLIENYKNCVHLKKICDIAMEYSYIKDIVNLSFQYFNSYKITELQNQHLIERIYDINGK